MKKFVLVSLVLLLVIIASLPIVGNRFMQQYTDDAVAVLAQQGLKLKTVKTNSSYLHTTKHFEFIVENSDAFATYLNTHTANKVPLNAASGLNGTVVGADLRYSNLPFAKSMTLDIYPIELSKEMQNELKTEDIAFYKKFTAFLHDKGILYHVEYNLINDKFSSYLQDIHQKYHLHNGSDVSVDVVGWHLDGKNVITDVLLKSRVKLIAIDANQTNSAARFYVKDFRSSQNMHSLSSYKSALSLKKLDMFIEGTGNDVNLSLEDFATASKAYEKKEHVTMESTTKLAAIAVNVGRLRFHAKNFQNSVTLKDLDKEALAHLSAIATQGKNMQMLAQQQAFQKAMMELLSKGFVLNISKLSLEKLVLNTKENLGGFTIAMDLAVKKDADLATKMQKSPLMLLANVKLESSIDVAQRLYEKLLQNSPMAQSIDSYAKKVGENVHFDVEFTNTKLYVNKKAIQ